MAIMSTCAPSELPVAMQAIADNVDWSQTATLVREWHPAAAKIAAELANYPYNCFWNPLTEKRSSVVDDNTRCIEPWVLVKVGSKTYHPLQAPFNGFTGLQEAVGGPSPLAAMLVGGGLGGLAGYGTGWLLSRFLPKKHFDKSRLPLSLAAAGAGLGTLPGLYSGTLKYRQVPGLDPPGTFGDLGLKWTDYGPLLNKASAYIEALPGEVDPDFLKAAGSGETGLDYAQTIPVDAFNNVVWAGAMPNAFGTKNPYGDNDQPLTPAPVAALTTGLVNAASAFKGGAPTVSPFEIGVAAAKTGLGGLLGGWALGKAMGALAGLKPESQERLQQIGLWGGILTGAVKRFLG